MSRWDEKSIVTRLLKEKVTGQVRRILGQPQASKNSGIFNGNAKKPFGIGDKTRLVSTAWNRYILSPSYDAADLNREKKGKRSLFYYSL